MKTIIIGFISGFSEPTPVSVQVKRDNRIDVLMAGSESPRVTFNEGAPAGSSRRSKGIPT